MSRIVQECTRLKKKVKRSFERSKLRCLAWSSCAIEARGGFCVGFAKLGICETDGI